MLNLCRLMPGITIFKISESNRIAPLHLLYLVCFKIDPDTGYFWSLPTMLRQLLWRFVDSKVCPCNIIGWINYNVYIVNAVIGLLKMTLQQDSILLYHTLSQIALVQTILHTTEGSSFRRRYRKLHQLNWILKVYRTNR